MRKIKFRGKRIDNGEWVYGCLTRYSKEMSYITVDLVENEVYQVYTETVGQFTGLEDKNNKEIYKGDIIKNTIGKLEKIVFNRGAFKTQSISYPNANLYLLDSYSDYIQVIGNIHDNPELMQS